MLNDRGLFADTACLAATHFTGWGGLFVEGLVVFLN